MTLVEIIAAMLFVAARDARVNGRRAVNFAEFDLLRAVYG